MKNADWALMWRYAVIVILTLWVLGMPLLFPPGQTLHPRTAAGLRFGILVDHGTGETCLVFRSDKPPEGLKPYLCGR